MSADLREPPVPPVASPLGRPYLLTVDRYYRLIDAGVIGEDEPIFLWKGRIVEKMTKHPPHNIALSKLLRRLFSLIPDDWYVAPEQPVRVGDQSLPEPDVTIVRGLPDDYSGGPPSTRDVSLVIEVADSSLAEDRGEMLRAYAGGGIPFYWIVNLRDRRIEVHSDPTGTTDDPRYRKIDHYHPGDEVPVILDGREVGRIAVNDVLP